MAQKDTLLSREEEKSASYQILVKLQPECLELHGSQGSSPVTLSLLKANTNKP